MPVILPVVVTDDESDDAPPTRIATDGERREHYATYPPGALVIGESGPAMPRTQFEADLHGRVRSLEDSRSFWKWAVGLGAPVLGIAIVTVLLYSADQVRSSAERVGETKAKIEAIDRRIDDFRGAFDKAIDKIIEDVRELRRRAGLDTRGTVAVGAP